MPLLIGAFMLSLIPAVLLYLWLKKRPEMPEDYAVCCRKALINGMLCTFPVILASAVLTVIGNLLLFKDRHTVIYNWYHTFIKNAGENPFLLAKRREGMNPA